MRRMLEPYTDVFSKSQPPKVPDWLMHHANINTVIEGIGESGRNPSEYFFFTTVRNPWARVFSSYKFGLSGVQTAWRKPALESKSLDEFVFHEFVLERWSRYTYDTFAKGADGVVLFDRIIRLENIGTELPPLIQTLTGDRLHVMHLNKSADSSYRDQYKDPAAIREVAKVFGSDIEAFDYTF